MQNELGSLIREFQGQHHEEEKKNTWGGAEGKATECREIGEGRVDRLQGDRRVRDDGSEQALSQLAPHDRRLRKL